MLDSLRSAVNSWPAKILLGLVLLSFVAWGGHSFLQPGADDTLLSAGQASVSAPDYEVALRNESLRLSMGAGRWLTPDELQRFGVRQAVFGDLYRNVLLDNAAMALRLGESDKTVADLLGRDPLFHNASGNFDRAAFDYYLQALRISQDKFLSEFYVRAARRDQISATIAGGADAPETFYQALALYTGQTRAADYAELKPEPLSAIAAPDEKTLAEWYKANAENFRTPEYRQISYLSLRPQDLSEAESVSAADIAAYYKAHAEQYISAPEKRSFTSVHFADAKAANAALATMEAAINSGQSSEAAFSAYLAAHKELKTEQKTDAAQADLPPGIGGEIFAVKSTGLSPVMQNLDGASLVLLTNITPAKPRPLAEVSAQIKQAIALKQAQSALPDLRKKIEDSRYDGANLKEIAAQYHLPLHEVTLDKNGLTPEGKNAGFPQADILPKNIFATPENTDADPLTLADGGYIWYNVAKILPPHISELSAVREKAIAAWKQEQQQQNLDERATALAKKLNSGADFAALAAEQKLILHNESGLKRDADNKILGRQAGAAIFAAAKGESGLSVAGNADNRIVFRIKAINEPQNAGRASFTAAQQSNIARQMEVDFLSSYLGAQARLTPVMINQTVYKRLEQDDN